MNWERVADPQISPDGRTIVYTRSAVNVGEDRFDSQLWVMDADGSRNRFLAEGGGAVWSPDSSRIAYVAGSNGGSAIFVRWMTEDRETTQISPATLSPSGLRWSPDSRSIAFRGTVPAAPKWKIPMPPRPAGAKWTEDATVIDTLNYRADRKGLIDGYRHLFILPADGGTPRQLTSGNWNVGAMFGSRELDTHEWMPNGREILFSGNMEVREEIQFGRSLIYALEVATSAIRPMVSTPGHWTSPTPSPDGQRIAFEGFADKDVTYAARELHVVNSDGSRNITLIEDAPGAFTYLDWAPNSRSLYYITEDRGSYNLMSMDLQGRRRQMTSGMHVLRLSNASRTGVGVGVHLDAERPDDIMRLDLKTGRNLRRLTAVNDDILRDVDVGKSEELWFPSSDDTKVQGWIIKPPDFNPEKKYPLLLYVHGGPHQMFDPGFFFRFQHYAAEGFIVLLTNPRGSTGYGSAFANAIDKAFPGRADMDDLLAGVDAVVARGYVDQERLYVSGCSGGGALVNWLVTQTDRFAAAASSCSISNWISFVGTTDVPMWGRTRFEKAFWDDPRPWIEHSPVFHANKVKTPTLLLTGEDDLRTPLSQAEEFYTALKLNNVPSKLIIMKREPHGTSSKPSNMIRVQHYTIGWLSSWRRVVDGNGPRWIHNDDEAPATQASGTSR